MFLLTKAIPLPGRVAIFCVAIASAWAWGYSYRDSAADAERTALATVAEQTNQRYRNLEQEVADAQKGYVHAWTLRNAESKRLLAQARASVAAGVPAIPAECGSAGTGEVPRLAVADEAVTATEAADAFAAGAELEARLTLCQSELRQCASLR